MQRQVLTVVGETASSSIISVFAVPTRGDKWGHELVEASVVVVVAVVVQRQVVTVVGETASSSIISAFAVPTRGDKWGNELAEASVVVGDVVVVVVGRCSGMGVGWL